MIIKKRPKSAAFIATDDIKSNTGKEIILKSMTNHYKTLLNAKPQIKIEEPKKIVGKHKTNVSRANEFYNVRQTYKSVVKVKAAVDTKKPFTYHMTKLSKFYTAKEKFEDMEHIRRLDAMSKRMISLGKPHERAKNNMDPITNPVYFCREENDEKGIKLVNLNEFNKKIKELNTNKRNQSILDSRVYEMIKSKNDEFYKKKTPIETNFLHGMPDVAKTPKNSKKYGDLDVGINPNFFIYTNPEEIIKEHLKERKINNFLKDKEKTQSNNFFEDQNKVFTQNKNIKGEESSSHNSQISQDKNNVTFEMTQVNKIEELSKNINNYKITNKSNLSNRYKNDNLVPMGIGKLEIYKNKQLIEQIPLYEYKPEAKEDFKNRIVKHLFSNRIYKNRDIEAFAKLLVHKNKDLLPEGEIKQLFLEVKKRLEE